MKEIHERLSYARKSAGFARPVDAIERFGYSKDTYYQHESGLRKPSKLAFQKYAKDYKVSLEWLMTGRGAPNQKHKGVPVLGNVGAAAAVFPIDTRPIEYIDPPPGSPPNAFALRVTGDSMLPLYEDGFILICMPVDDVRDVINRRAVVDLNDGRRLVKKVTRGSKAGLFTLVSQNASDITDVKITQAARVIWIKEP